MESKITFKVERPDGVGNITYEVPEYLSLDELKDHIFFFLSAVGFSTTRERLYGDTGTFNTNPLYKKNEPVAPLKKEDEFTPKTDGSPSWLKPGIPGCTRGGRRVIYKGFNGNRMFRPYIWTVQELVGVPNDAYDIYLETPTSFNSDGQMSDYDVITLDLIGPV